MFYNPCLQTPAFTEDGCHLDEGLSACLQCLMYGQSYCHQEQIFGCTVIKWRAVAVCKAVLGPSVSAVLLSLWM